MIKVFTESGQPHNVAYEVHGANTRFVTNHVSNCYQGVWVASNHTSAVKDIIIQGNAFGPLRGVGVDFCRMKASERPVTKGIINRNTFHFTDEPFLYPGIGTPVRGFLKAAVQKGAVG